MTSEQQAEQQREVGINILKRVIERISASSEDEVGTQAALEIANIAIETLFAEADMEHLSIL